MRVAVQIFGHLRTYKACVSTLQRHLLREHDCDVFMHTWDMSDSQGATWHHYKRRRRPVKERESNELWNLYDIKDLVIEKEKEWSEEDREVAVMNNKGRYRLSWNSFRSMQYSVIKANKLRIRWQEEHQVHYDWVVCLRPDVLLKSTLPLQELEKACSIARLEMCRFSAASCRDGILLGDIASDVLYIAKPDAMDCVVNVMEEINRSECIPEMWTPECFLQQELVRNGITTYFLRFPYGQCWELRRFISWHLLRRNIMSIKIRKQELRVRFAGFIPHIIMRAQIALPYIGGLDISIGNDDGC